MKKINSNTVVAVKAIDAIEIVQISEALTRWTADGGPNGAVDICENIDRIANDLRQDEEWTDDQANLFLTLIGLLKKSEDWRFKAVAGYCLDLIKSEKAKAKAEVQIAA